MCCLLTGCGTPSVTSNPENPDSMVSSMVSDSNTTPAGSVLPDGVYQAEFKTDSSMFRVNESCNGKGMLTVKDGKMTIHVSLMSQKIVNLFPGMAEDAQKEGAVWLEPTIDTVTYSDGLSEEVYGFDIPVPVIGEEFDLALVGTKNTWYDHKVIVQNPEILAKTIPEDGTYTCALTLEGGTGRASIESPAKLRVENGTIWATLVWSSSNYDYMKVEGVRYPPINTGGNSIFEIPVATLDAPFSIIADTVAMSTPHEVEYTLAFHADTLQAL